MAEGETDHLVIRDRRAAAVTFVDRGVDLDFQSGDRITVWSELDPRDDPFCDRETRAPGWITVNRHRVGDRRERFRLRNRQMRIEKRFVVELQHREINSRRNRFDGRGNLVGGLVGLHLHLTGIQNDMRVREDAFTLDHNTAAGDGSTSFALSRAAWEAKHALLRRRKPAPNESVAVANPGKESRCTGLPRKQKPERKTSAFGVGRWPPEV